MRLCMTRGEAVGDKYVEVYPAVIPARSWPKSIMGLISLCGRGDRYLSQPWV